MHKYDQSSGIWYGPDGKILSRGYSGNGRGVNNPAMQAAKGIGPIPRGIWRMTELRLTGASTGPYTIVVEPTPTTMTFGRSLFRVHGDNAKLNRSASHGCIILPRPDRVKIWTSGDRLVEVVE